MTDSLKPPQAEVTRVLEIALAEDLATAGDLTTDSVFDANHTTRGRIVARQEGRIAGIGMALQVFAMLDGRTEATVTVPDGSDAAAGATIAEVAGPTRAVLTGERTCLNLLGHLCGIATATRDAVALTAASQVSVVDTRKTTPGLRALEKYAVRCGGGSNHRFGLHDAVMIKDNHIAAAGSIEKAVAAVRRNIGHMVKIEVEVDRLEQIAPALNAGADVILLDNMEPEALARAVAVIDGAAITEASGGITKQNIAAVAATGVDVISLGALTHSSPRLDVALDIDN